MDLRPVTIGERIVVHLSQYLRFQDAYVCPPGMAQAGIADSIGISRAHAAIELKRQMTAGRVAVRVAHVSGITTRRKVYHLTARGEGVARTVRDRAFQRQLQIVGPDGREEEVPGSVAVERMRRCGVTEARGVLLVLTRPRIDLNDAETLRKARALAWQTSPSFLGATSAKVSFGSVGWQLEAVLGPPYFPGVPVAA